MAAPAFTMAPGVYPTMITPFSDDGSTIDYEGVNSLVDFYLEAGCMGVFTVCQSSEMFDLTNEERLALAKAVKARAGDKTVLACGTFGGAIAEQAAFVNELGKVVDAVVVIVSVLAKEEEGDDVWKANCEELLALTPGVTLGLYECPAPYHRLLSPELLAWTASTGRFAFHKDTSRSPGPIHDKLAAIAETVGGDSPFRFYNGNVTTLLHSLREGGAGFSGVSANFYPWLHVWLVSNFKAMPEAADKVQRFLGVVENTVKAKYPSSAKVYLSMAHGDRFSLSPACRTGGGTPTWLEEERMKLRFLHESMLELCADTGLDIKPLK